MSAKWCTIESDPGVFTELVQDVGVKGVQFEELMTLEDEELNQVKPIYGLIFLFKWVPDKEPRQILYDYDPELFFANQVINNACATQAILSILLNRTDEIEIGEELSTLREFSTGLPSNDKGWTIGNSEKIRIAHNSFSRQDPFIIEEDREGTKEEDAFHFISYVPFKGQLYELDGLQKGPISHGDCTPDNWLSLARTIIMKRIQEYSNNEIRFNLLAVIGDKVQQAQKELEKLQMIQQYLHEKLAGNQLDPNEFSSVKTEIEELEKQNQESMQASLVQIGQSIEQRQAKVIDEQERKKQWKVENERRRHNYVPLIFELLQQLAKKDMIDGMFKEAVEKKKQKVEQAKAQGKDPADVDME